VSLALIAYVFVFVKKSPPKQKRAWGAGARRQRFISRAGLTCTDRWRLVEWASALFMVLQPSHDMKHGQVTKSNPSMAFKSRLLLRDVLFLFEVVHTSPLTDSLTLYQKNLSYTSSYTSGYKTCFWKVVRVDL
jgi:hypothetical protein